MMTSDASDVATDTPMMTSGAPVMTTGAPMMTSDAPAMSTGAPMMTSDAVVMTGEPVTTNDAVSMARRQFMGGDGLMHSVTCDELKGQGCAVMDALCPKIDCPTECAVCFKPIVSVPLTSSSPAPTTQKPGNGLMHSVTCSELTNLGCGALDALCPQVDCPDVCDPCFKPIVTVASPTNNQAKRQFKNVTCEELTGLGCGVLDALCPTVDCPDVCDPCFKPIVTASMAPVDTTTASASDAGPTAAACEDTIQQMNCVDVEDVCSNPMLLPFCRKFCGTCS